MPTKKPKLIECQRTGQEYDAEEHLRCPYCFGKEKDMTSAEPERFCDFEPGKDPINFGFPENSSRNQES
jgi:hypothetical protein